MRPGSLVALAITVAVGGCGGSGDAARRPEPTPSPVGESAVATVGPTAPVPPTAVPATPPPPTKAATPTPPRPATTRYVFPLRCGTSYGHAHHDYPATDMFAARGCPFVSPVDGRVDEVSRADRWSPSTDRGADRGGLFVSVVGADGVRYYGSHLSAVAGGIGPGVRVRAGTVLGRVGTSGSARGVSPHLHFGLSWPTGPGVWWVRRGVVYPWPYLDSWRAGGLRSPVAAVEASRARGVRRPAGS